jgi:hypothetical protein
MKRFLLVAALLVTTTPAFADKIWDDCWKVTTDRVGPVTQSSRGHFQSLFRECLRGNVPYQGHPVTVTSRSGARSLVEHDPDHDQGKIKCVTGTDGVKRCF